MSDRPLRICDVCGGVDDHPRHVLAAAVGEIPVNSEHAKAVLAMSDLSEEERQKLVDDIFDTSTQLRHMDCCAQVGCPDGSCDEIIKAMPGSYVKGNKLVAFLTSGEVDKVGAKITAKNAGGK